MDLFKNYKSKEDLKQTLLHHIYNHKDEKLSNDMGLEVFKIEGLKYSYKNTISGFGNINPVNFNNFFNHEKVIQLQPLNKFREVIKDFKSLVKETETLLNTPFIKIYETPFTLIMDKEYYLIVCFEADEQYFCKFKFEIKK